MAPPTATAAEVFGRGRDSALPAGVASDAGRSRLIQLLKPFMAVAAVIVTGSILVAAIYFTDLGVGWVAFLAGVLFASMLAMVSRAARSELVSASQAERLGIIEYRLLRETEDRGKIEGLLAAATARLSYFDESPPVMLAFVDHNTRYLYHNRAFREWLGLQAEKIDGKHVREVLGRKIFAEIETYVSEVGAGRIVRFERTHKAPAGAVYRLAVQYLPQFGDDGKYTGFYMVMTDVTEQSDLLLPAERTAVEQEAPPRIGPEQSSAAPASAWEDASRSILNAINSNEFALFFQRISPLAHDAAAPCHYEMLIRLLEEESGQVPPGAFFPLAEELGLLPQLDRWVFAHLLEWLVTPAGANTVRNGAIYFINIAAATISDPEFPEFVDYQLRRSGVSGRSVCVEIAESYLTTKQGDAVQFARSMKGSGCLVAISGFGRSPATVGALKLFPVDFLKIDGGIVRQIIKYPTFLGKVVAINRVAKAIGIRTIAEMVEDEPTLAKLRELQVDFAQGFGISRPQPLADLEKSG